MDHPSLTVGGATGVKRTGYVQYRQGNAADPAGTAAQEIPAGPRRAWSHFRKSRCAACRELKPADSSEYRHLKSVRRRTSCAVSAARILPRASLASRIGTAVEPRAAPSVVPSSGISSPVIAWYKPAGPHRGHAFRSCAGRHGPSVRQAQAGVSPTCGLAKPHSGRNSSLARAALPGVPHPLCPEQLERPPRECVLALDGREGGRGADRLAVAGVCVQCASGRWPSLTDTRCTCRSTGRVSGHARSHVLRAVLSGGLADAHLASPPWRGPSYGQPCHSDVARYGTFRLTNITSRDETRGQQPVREAGAVRVRLVPSFVACLSP